MIHLKQIKKKCMHTHKIEISISVLLMSKPKIKLNFI